MALDRRAFMRIVAFGLLAESALGHAFKEEADAAIGKTLPKGIFCATNTNNSIILDGKRINLFDMEVDCVSNYARWASIEKEPGNFSWGGFERMLKEASVAGKMTAYHIMPGIHTPDWAYQSADIDPYSYTYKKRDQKKVTSYLPWIEKEGARMLNSGMLEVWERTVKAYSHFIRNHAEKDRIAYVSITGGPTSNGLEIMWQQSFYEEFQKIRWDREAEDLFIEYWKGCVDIFIKYFPEMPLGLALTDYFGVNRSGQPVRNYRIPRMIVQYALDAARLKGATVVPMGMWIGALNPALYESNSVMRLLRSFNASFALQGPMGTKLYSRLESMLSFGVSSSASWMELWHQDVTNSEYRPLIKKYRKELLQVR